MNVANILEKLQSGTRLYSALHGKTVEFVKVIDGNSRPIKIRQIGDSSSSAYESFYEDGSFVKGGECMLFPNKENRDWYNISIFKDGDIVVSKHSVCIISSCDRNGNINIHCAVGHCSDENMFTTTTTSWTRLDDVRKANEKEVERLMIAIAKNGYEWDKENLRLKKKTYIFKPYERVLVRDKDNQNWMADFFGYECSSADYQYNCIGSTWSQCIPYEGNESLLGTTGSPE